MKIEVKAKELADAIVDSPELTALRKAEVVLNQDESAQSLIGEFNSFQQKLYEQQMEGKELTDEQKKAAEDIEKRMQAHPTLAMFIEKQKDFEKLMQAVNLIISRAISGGDGCECECGSDCGPSCGGGCC